MRSGRLAASPPNRYAKGVHGVALGRLGVVMGRHTWFRWRSCLRQHRSQFWYEHGEGGTIGQARQRLDRIRVGCEVSAQQIDKWCVRQSAVGFEARSPQHVIAARLRSGASLTDQS